MSEIDDNDSCQSAEEALEDELYTYCSSAALKTDGIHEIIERHKLLLTPNNNHQVSDYEFFHSACRNEKVTEGIIQCLLEYFPAAVNTDVDGCGLLPLHYACKNCNVSLGIIQLLIDAAPDTVRHQDIEGYLPLHCLCSNKQLGETPALEILKLLLEKHPESIRHKIDDGFLPIHMAAVFAKSSEFFRVLIDAYPGSERIADDVGMMPFHYACMRSTLAVVEYLYERHPDAVNHETTSGLYPIHIAIVASLDKIEALKIVKFLLGCDPNVKFQEVSQSGQPLLHFACHYEYDDISNTIALVEIIEAIHDAHPEFIRKEDFEGGLLLHQLCAIQISQSETIRMAILKLLLEKYPQSIRHENDKGLLPIHIAAANTKSLEFCSMLIEAYPGSERMPTTSTGMLLPFHYACVHNTVAIVEYLYNLYPDAIDQTASPGVYPIHAAFRSVIDRKENKRAAVDVVKFLLDCDPRVKSQKLGGIISLFGSVYFQNYDDTNIGAAMDIIKVIYDADPEAIESQSIASTSDGRHPETCHPQMQAFVSSQMGYSRLASVPFLTTTRDENGRLALHIALEIESSVRLGSIKLLVKGNPHALQTPDNDGALPLHVACMHSEFARVVQYLVELDATTLEAVDHDNNTALHYACRGAKYETIVLLLENYDAVSVSKRNAEGKLPIDLLWESNRVVDRESVEYTESIFRLLRAYPETVMNCI